MASPNTYTKDWTSLVTTTLDKYLREEATDNIYEGTALLAHLTGSGRKETFDGGILLVEPLMYALNGEDDGSVGTVKSITGSDAVTLRDVDPITTATFSPAFYTGVIQMTREEMLKNAGSRAIMSLYDAKVKALELGFKTKLNKDMYADGTGNGGKNITGLDAVLKATGTYGNINRATYTWWQPQLADYSAENGATGRALAVKDMATMYNNCVWNGSGPDIIITDQEIWEEYELLAYNKTTIFSKGTQRLADLGFQVLEYKGVPITWEREVDTTFDKCMLFLNGKNLKLQVHSNAEFKRDEQTKPDDKLVYYQQVYWMGQITCNELRTQGKIKGLKRS